MRAWTQPEAAYEQNRNYQGDHRACLEVNLSCVLKSDLELVGAAIGALTASPAHLRRVYDSASGLALIKP